MKDDGHDMWLSADPEEAAVDLLAAFGGNEQAAREWVLAVIKRYEEISDD